MSKRVNSTLEKRQRIISAAISSIVIKGIHQTSIRDIAAIANISVGNLYNHFAGKEELVAEIASLESEEIDIFIDMLKPNGSAWESLQNFINQYTAYVSSSQNAILTIEIISLALRDPKIGIQFSNNRKALVDALKKLIVTGTERGEYRQGIDGYETALLILDTIEGLGMRAGLSGKKPGKKAKTALTDMIFRALSGSIPQR